MSKNYTEWNEAEQLIMDYLQAYAYERTNYNGPYEKKTEEILLEDMAKELDLID